MTQIRAEDIDFSKGYLHVQAVNAKFKKPRTVVLLPKVAEAWRSSSQDALRDPRAAYGAREFGFYF